MENNPQKRKASVLIEEKSLKAMKNYQGAIVSNFCDLEGNSFIWPSSDALPGMLNDSNITAPFRSSSGIKNIAENGAEMLEPLKAMGGDTVDDLLLPQNGPGPLEVPDDGNQLPGTKDPLPGAKDPLTGAKEPLTGAQDPLTGEPVKDRAGNNRSRAYNLHLLIGSKSLREFVGKSDRQDFYEFKLKDKTDITIALSELDGNADLYLLNRKGKVIKKSINAGKTEEEIERTLNPGTYYVRVRSKNKNVNTHYKLSLGRTGDKDDLGYQTTQILIKAKQPEQFGSGKIKNLAQKEGFGPKSVNKIVHQRDPNRDDPVFDWKVIEVEAGTDLEALKERLLADPRIEAVEFNNNISLSAKTNDTEFDELWGLHNTGQTGGSKNADINATQAWNTQMGSEDVVVAVIDSGVDYEHPDLEDNMWTNSEEIAGNSKDDDGNGYVDDVYGYDWIDSDSDPMDDNSHGTHVAGIIGAVGDNSLGVTGVSPEVSIMALRFMDADGNGTTSGVAQAITYAADNGADIINASFAGTSSSVLMEEAIEYASDKGVLFVAAAGNSGEDNDATPNYPANYDIDNILAVAATDSEDELASFSNYGETSVDMAAPGVSILSTVPGEDYETMSGTSMATPHVAGAAAVLLAEKPNLSVKRLRNLLKNKGRKLDSLADSTATGRRLRLNTSLNVIS